MKNSFVYNPVQTTPFSFKEKIKSHLWKLVNATIFKIFPNQIKKPRILLLRLFGAKLSNSVNINRSSKIDHPWNLTMGELSSLGHNSWTYCLDKITIGKKNGANIIQAIDEEAISNIRLLNLYIITFFDLRVYPF